MSALIFQRLFATANDVKHITFNVTSQKIGTMALHILCWATFLFLPYVFVLPPSQVDPTVLPEFDVDPDNIAVARDMVANAIIILFFYLNIYLIVPRFYFRRKYFSFAVITVLSYGLVKFSPFFVPPFEISIPVHVFDSPIHIVTDWNHHLFRFTLVFLISVVFAYHARWREIQQEKLRSELMYLKAQINPHFLFNTVNGIYSMAVTNSSKTADALAKFAGLLRYAASEASSAKVPVQKEINYISDYVDLQMLRWGKNANITFDVNCRQSQEKIEPSLLLPFVENAIKYGINGNVPNAFVNIKLRCTDGQLSLYVSNLKVRKSTATDSSGISINNVKRRLELLYPNNHVLSIRNTDDRFTVELFMNLI
jgi:sensor histidine kinase YesM